MKKYTYRSCRPGALVVAHSLKDAGTTKKIAVLVTTDTVSADAMVQLQVKNTPPKLGKLLNLPASIRLHHPS